MGLPISFDRAPLMLSLFVQELVYVQFDEWWGGSEGRNKGSKRVIIKMMILTVMIMIMITMMLTVGRILMFLNVMTPCRWTFRGKTQCEDYSRSIPKIIRKSLGRCTNLPMHVIWGLGWSLIMWWWGWGWVGTLVLEEGTGKEIVFRIFRSPWVGMSVDQLLWKANQAVFLVESIV